MMKIAHRHGRHIAQIYDLQYPRTKSVVLRSRLHQMPEVVVIGARMGIPLRYRLNRLDRRGRWRTYALTVSVWAGSCRWSGRDRPIV